MGPLDDPHLATGSLGEPAADREPKTEADRLATEEDGAEFQRRIAARVRDRLFAPGGGRTLIGRFVVLEEIGRGGMGRVHAAYDEQLDRKVAIKVLLDEEIPTEEERLRFQREAQALARLSHPNVVTVHEVGEDDGRLFVAMEYVRGQSFARWLRTEPDWPQVLEAFIRAGRGLLAAHEAGLVHRDLKPSNLMRSDDGAVKVLDFGLARVAADELHESVDYTSPTGSYSAMTSLLTKTGVLMGTPAYMAPEQFEGTALDARSDQYSFCVALWEGLTGSRPFDESSIDAIVEARREGPPPWPSGAPPVPRPIVESIRRGLQPSPDDRWPSMAALLRALSWNDRRRRGRWRWGLVGVTIAGLSGATIYAWSEARGRPCAGAQEQLDGIWDEGRRAEVAAAFLEVEPSYAADVWTWVEPELDGYAEAWVAMHTEACEATAVSGAQSPRVMDLRMACLRRGSTDLRATVDTLADADATVVHHAHELVSGLPPVSRCADVEALEAELEPPLPRDAEAVQRARRSLAQASSERRAGRYAAARTAVEAAELALGHVDYGPARAELSWERGEVHDELGEYEAAERAFSEALELASTLGLRGLTADAAISLMSVVGHRKQRATEAMLLRPLVMGSSKGDPRRLAQARSILGAVLLAQGRFEEAEAEHRAALALGEQTLDPEHPAIANSLNNLANVLAQQGKYDEAEAKARTALALTTAARGPKHPNVGIRRNDLAAVLTRQGKLEEAEAEHRAALAVRVGALGPRHPSVAESHNNLAVVLAQQGRMEEATAGIRAALTIWEEALGPQHPYVLASRTNIAGTLLEQGKYEEAEQENRTVLALRLEALGPQHPDIAQSRANLASTLKSQGKHEEAEAEYRAALALNMEARGPDHPTVAGSRHGLANVLFERARYEEAEAEYRAALAIREQALDADHPAVARLRSDLARALLMLDRPEEALEMAEAAWPRLQRDDIAPGTRAEAAFVLARITKEIEGPRRNLERSRELAEDALRMYRAAGHGHERDAGVVERWLQSP